MKLIYSISVLLMLITTVHGQIVLEPVVRGTAENDHVDVTWCWPGSPATYTNCTCYTDPQLHERVRSSVMHAGIGMLNYSYVPCDPPNYSCWCQETHGQRSLQACLEFNILSTVSGEILPTEHMTEFNWNALLNNLMITQVNGAGETQDLFLYDMHDDCEDGLLETVDFACVTDIKSHLYSTIPESGTVLTEIDVTEMLRNDLFGSGTGQDTTGFVMISSSQPGKVGFERAGVTLEIRMVTPTPLPTVAPTVTPSPTPVTWRGVKMILPGSPFTGGDLFKLRAQCMGDFEMVTAKLFVILDVYGSYWFHPGWKQSLQFEVITLNPTRPVVSFILDFIWPENINGSADGLAFWGAVTDPQTSDLIGDFDRVEFEYY